jgi:hypothetical protein
MPVGQGLLGSWCTQPIRSTTRGQSCVAPYRCLHASLRLQLLYPRTSFLTCYYVDIAARTSVASVMTVLSAADVVLGCQSAARVLIRGGYGAGKPPLPPRRVRTCAHLVATSITRTLQYTVRSNGFLFDRQLEEQRRRHQLAHQASWTAPPQPAPRVPHQQAAQLCQLALYGRRRQRRGGPGTGNLVVVRAAARRPRIWSESAPPMMMCAPKQTGRRRWTGAGGAHVQCTDSSLLCVINQLDLVVGRLQVRSTRGHGAPGRRRAATTRSWST